MRVDSVSSRVRLPELPEARMETRRPIGNTPNQISLAKANSRMMAERADGVNEEGSGAGEKGK